MTDEAARTPEPVADGDDFGKLALALGMVSEERIDSALLEARSSGRSLADVLFTRKDLSEGQLVELLKEREELHGAHSTSQRKGRYYPLHVLGRGGMAEVWKAWDVTLRRWVAIKYLCCTEPNDRKRFLQEARLAAKLIHPNIVRVHEVLEDEGRLGLVMDFIDGNPLNSIEMPGQMRERARWIRDAALAVHAAHLEGITHRDLKPHNLMVDLSGKVWVLDFGLARVQQSGPSLTQPGTVIGTPEYMPPELVSLDRAQVGPRSDVYSLGATLYRLVTGRPPFVGESPLTTLSHVLYDDLPAPRSVQSACPPDLEAIILRAMERNPNHRYPSAKALANDLDRWIRGESIAARSPTPWRRWLDHIRRKPTLAWVPGISLGVLIGVSILLSAWVAARNRARREEGRVARLVDSVREQEERRTRADALVVEGNKWLSEFGARSDQKETPQEELQSIAALARDRFRDALSFAPSHPQAYLGLARAHARIGRTDQARETLDALIRVHPTFAPGFLDRARLTLEDAVHEEHEGDVDPSAFPASDALSDLHAAQKLLSTPEDAVLVSGMERFARGDYAGAEERFRGYLAVRQEDGAAHRWRGHALCHLNRLPEAEEELTRAIRQDGLDAEAYRMRAFVRDQMGCWNDALQDYDLALRFTSRPWQVHLNRADGFARREKSKEAMADFDQAVQLRPDSARPIANRAVERFRTGDVGGALEDFSRALAMAPADAEVRLNLGVAKAKMGDLSGALVEYAEAIRLRPTLFQAYFNRGNLHSERHAFGPALEDFTKAVEIRPTHSLSWHNRALALYRLERYLEARVDVDQALQLDPDYAKAYGLRAFVRNRLHDAPGARKDAERALRLGVDETMRRNLEALIRGS